MLQHYLRQRYLMFTILVLCISTFFLLAGTTIDPSKLSDDADMPQPIDRATQLQATSTGQSTQTDCDDPELPFYGMEFVPIDELDYMQQMGINMVLHAFDYDGTPQEWLEYLDVAQQHNIRVVGRLWPEGWSFDRDANAWRVDERARLFLTTIKEHPALFAVYALHEPYWNGCDGCGYTTAQQQMLYQTVKAIADIPIYSEIDSMSYWSKQGEDTKFADGICDYCQTLYYPFRSSGAYEYDKLVESITADLAVARALGPNSRIVWTMQGFAQGAPYFLRMPTSEEMVDLATLVYSYDIAGAWWYPWEFDDEYSDTLSEIPELHPTIRLIYDTIVAPLRPTPTPAPIPTTTQTISPSVAPTAAMETSKAGDSQSVYLPFILYNQ